MNARGGSSLVAATGLRLSFYREGGRGSLLGIGMLMSVVSAMIGLCSPGTAQAACVNEMLRSELNSRLLPDCRAYELLTPEFTGGYQLVSSFSASYAPEGNELITTSLGSFGGSLGAGTGTLTNLVQLNRTPAGWQARSETPPSPPYTAVTFDAGEPSGRALWYGHTDDQSLRTTNLYFESPGNEMRLIGPAFPTSYTEGPVEGNELQSAGLGQISSSVGYGHVIFSLEKRSAPGGAPRIYWPFDNTQSINYGSVYEYAGLGNSRPRLVGVIGGLDSAALVSECGTLLGSGSGGSTYNALSSDGETVFFTPVASDRESCGAAAQPTVAEVYARVDGSTARARTANVSEPSPTECEGECVGAIGEDKIFQGASEDGSMAFFTSTQALITGAKEGQMNLYEYDFTAPSGHNLSLIAGGEVQGVTRVSEDGSHVYFVAGSVLTSEPSPSLSQGHQIAVAGGHNLYVFDTQTRSVKFVATLSASDSADWAPKDERPVQATPDGRFLLFLSGSQLTPDDHSIPQAPQLFEYNDNTSELVRVTGGEAGIAGDGNVTEIPFGYTARTFERLYRRELEFGLKEYYTAFSAHISGGARPDSMSTDGSTVAFQTVAMLSLRATASQQPQPCTSVYEFHSPNAIATNGTVALLSSGHDISKYVIYCGTRYEGIDAGGANVLMATYEALRPGVGEANNARKLYDARIDGGFSPPFLSGECAGEGCHGPLSGAPQMPQAGSSSQGAGENVRPSAVGGRVRIVNKSVTGKVITLVVRTPSGGTITGHGVGLRSSTRDVMRAGTFVLKLTLSRRLQAAIHKLRKKRRNRTHKLTIGVRFESVSGKSSHASVRATVKA